MECPRCAGIDKYVMMQKYITAPTYVIFRCPTCRYLRRLERRLDESPPPQEIEKMRRTKTWKGATVLCTGIGAITAMELVALSQGIDGILLTGSIGAVVALVAGYCGFAIGRKNDGD